MLCSIAAQLRHSPAKGPDLEIRECHEVPHNAVSFSLSSAVALHINW